MDDKTIAVLALQLAALFSVACAMVLYLLCKIRPRPGEQACIDNMPGAGKAVLVTSCENSLGLQIAIHLANMGFRVFAGLRCDESNNSVSSKIIMSWKKHRESFPGLQGALVVVPLDVTREDILHESVDIIRAHLPAGYDGIWAIINTNSMCFRGRLDQQDVAQWDAMMKTNVIGLFRVARTFRELLRGKTGPGRIVTFGVPDVPYEAGLVAYVATKHAVEGASISLQKELQPFGIKTVILQTQGIPIDLLNAPPKMLKRCDEQNEVVDINGVAEYEPLVLSSNALRILDVALTTINNPKGKYVLSKNSYWSKPLDLIRIA